MASSGSRPNVPTWDLEDGILDHTEGSPRRITIQRLFGTVADRVCEMVSLGPDMQVPKEIVLDRPSGDAYLSRIGMDELVPACRVMLDPEFAGAAFSLVHDVVDALGRVGFIARYGRHRHGATLLETDLGTWRPKDRSAWSCELKTTSTRDLRIAARQRTSALRAQLLSEARWSGHVIVIAYLDWDEAKAVPSTWRLFAECINASLFQYASLDAAWVPLFGYSSSLWQGAEDINLQHHLGRAAEEVQRQVQIDAGAGSPVAAPQGESVGAVAAAHRLLLHAACVLVGDARRDRIRSVLYEGASALQRQNVEDIVKALVTSVALLSAPRRCQDPHPVAGSIASSGRPEDVAPSLQPALRSLVLQLLSSLDLNNGRDWLAEPLGHLGRLMAKFPLAW